MRTKGGAEIAVGTVVPRASFLALNLSQMDSIFEIAYLERRFLPLAHCVALKGFVARRVDGPRNQV